MPATKRERTAAPHGASAEGATARPTKGPVDFSTMRRDIKAKFPKTIARLAK